MLKTLFGLKVEGLENLPKKSNFIVVANHASFLDPLIIAAAIPQKIQRILFLSLLHQPVKYEWNRVIIDSAKKTRR